MFKSHVVNISLCFFVLFLSSLYFLSSMELLRVGSLNINGGRDGNKLAMVSELFGIKKINVAFLQETHSSVDNESEWSRWWEGTSVLSHGTNISAGIAILFAKGMNVNILAVEEIVKGRILLLKIKYEGSVFVLINVYASNNGPERVRSFLQLRSAIQKIDDDVCTIIGGDWNCTIDFILDRNGEEPHHESSVVLLKILKKFDLIDIWRRRNTGIKQYTWLKASNNRVSGARLDRFYIGKEWNNKIAEVSIFPVGFSDHHLILFALNMKRTSKPNYFWHFNTKLLQDALFCENFIFFWNDWKLKKVSFENVLMWWEVGKANIRTFCQNYSSHSTSMVKAAVQKLQRDIQSLENILVINKDDGRIKNEHLNKKKELGSLLQEQVKGALIRARICSIKDMDAPSSYFFNLEKKSVQQKQMYHLRRPDGVITSDPLEIRKLAVNFYTDLYDVETCDLECMSDLLSDLPKLTNEQKESLDGQITFQEITEAMRQLSNGRSPGIDGLPAEFYQTFWNVLGSDLYEVLLESVRNKVLPVSCRRAVLSLLPKKGDLCLLKNWRPVSLLCMDYKIISKCLANRLKHVLEVLVHRDQTYCIPNRSIMDNLFLLRDVIDLNQFNNVDLGVLSLDQEKAFDRVNHTYLYEVLKNFGFGKNFISYIQLLYSEVFVIVKAGGGLSAPIPVLKGIRQGCPLSGQLYSLVIEPLLCRLRRDLSGINVMRGISISAYADDVTVFISNQNDVNILTETMRNYGKASSARVNWGKSEGLIIGQWKGGQGPPKLPGGLLWERDGLKMLGCFFGNKQFQNRNWEGMLEKVSARLFKWKSLLPLMSYRGRVLVVNNLAASTLWHRLIVMEPPEELICKIQRTFVDFFWSGEHWIRAAALYLPVYEGGQGLVDVRSKISAFRIQAAQRFLYCKDLAWTETAKMILQKAGGLKLDRHLFLMELHKVNLSEITPFYRSMLHSWRTVFKVERDVDESGSWIREECLFFNPMIQTRLLSAVSVRACLQRHGIVKLGQLLNNDRWESVETLKELTGLKSSRLTEKLVEEIVNALPSGYRKSIGQGFLSDPSNEPDFPKIRVAAVVGERQEDESTGSILSFKTPQLDLFKTTSKKAIYNTAVKVLHQVLLRGQKISRWPVLLKADFLVRDRWRTLYKPPIEKRTADLQWRIIHGAIATDKHVAHLNPVVGVGCRFCGEEENLEHLFLKCKRLEGLFDALSRLFQALGEEFSEEVFIGGVKYNFSKRRKMCLLNYLIGTAKLAIWKTRKNQGLQLNSTNVEVMFKKLVAGRLKIEFVYYSLVNNETGFSDLWCVNEVLCVVSDGHLVLQM